MTNDERPVLIYTTFPSLEEAKRVGDALVKREHFPDRFDPPS